MVVEEKACRLCWGGEDGGPLMQPCACRGSAKWIHEHCLEEWRRTSPKEDAAYRCGQCRDEYRDALSLELLSARLQAERTLCQTTCLTPPLKEARAPADGLRTRPCTRNTLADELRIQGKYEEAEPLYREALQVMRETLGNRHPSTLATISNLGALLRDKGDLVAAEPLCCEALELHRETLGNRHRSTLTTISILGALLYIKRDLAAAEPLFREALEVARDTLGNRHPGTLAAINNLGVQFHAKDDLAAAEPLFREALAGQRETLGNRHPRTLFSIESLDELLQAKGKLRPAEKFRGTARRWVCGARRSAVGFRARFAPQSASVAPSVAPSVGCS